MKRFLLTVALCFAFPFFSAASDELYLEESLEGIIEQEHSFILDDEKDLAPKLTYAEIKYIVSSDCIEGEPIGDNQLKTACDHGGENLTIVTVEHGYGRPFVKMEGKSLRLFRQERLIEDGVIYGFERYWEADGFQDGKVIFSSRSINSPFNKMEDWIDIK